MYEFLSFKTFITPYVLIIFYYIGAVAIPLLLYFYKKKLLAWLGLEIKFHARVKLIFLIMFFIMELIWRMGFEMLLAYFQIHEILEKMSNQ